MFLKVNKSEFLAKVRVVEKAISENKIRPIISCVYLKASGDELYFCGTNLELTITSTIKCEVFEEGRITFQPQLIEEYVKEISDEFIILKTKEDNLLIEADDSSSEFALMNVEEFPMLPNDSVEDLDQYFNIKGNELLEIFEKVKFSAAATSENLSIHCIRVEVANNIIKFVATDTYRLVCLSKEITANNNASVSIPLNSVDAITKLLRLEELGEISILLKENRIYFMVGDIKIVSKIIELPFPNYEGILSTAVYNKTMIIENEEITKLLKRILIFVRNNNESKNGAVFDFKDSKINITGVNDIARIKEDKEINFTGDDLKISLNVKFLVDFLQNLPKEEKIVVEFKESNSSVKITGSKNEDYIYIVMPLALKDF